MTFDFIKKDKRLLTKLTLAFLLFIIASIGFVAIAAEVRDGDTMWLDRSILLAIDGYANPSLDAFFVTITNLGGVKVVAVAAILLAVYFVYRKRYYRALMIGVGVGGAAALNVVLKLLFERDRPQLWERLVTETSTSFPSGHAMASSALALSVVAILWYTKWRPLAIVLAALYIALIGLSRLYLGVHYPTDVLAGWLVSFVWVLVVAGLIYARQFRRRYTLAGKANDVI